MAIKVDLDNYNYAADELIKAPNHFNSASSSIETVLGSLDYRVLAYVKEDLYDIKNSLNSMKKAAILAEEELLETKHKYEEAEEKAKQAENKASSIVSTLSAVSIGAATGGAVGAAVGGAVSVSKVKDSKVEEATGGFLSKAFKSVSNFVTGTVSKVGNAFKKAGEVIKDTGAKVANFVTSAASKVASFFCDVGDFLWTGIKKVGASIANVVIGLVQGLAEFVEAIIDTAAIIVTAVASIFTGLWDLGQFIYGKITGNEDWNSATKAMWGGVMDFVGTTHVKNAFRGFYENTAVGKWLDANAFEWFKSTGAVYQIANGIGYVAGVVILTIVTFGAGGAAVGASSAATGAATTAVTAGQTAVVAATAGFGRGAETAWSQGATLEEGLMYATANAGWEGLQFYVGAKIGAPGGYGDKVASVFLKEGTKASTRALVTSGTRVILDSADGGLEGFVQPLMQTIYADGYYDDNGNFVEFTDGDGVFTRADALFDDMGGWSNVGIQAAIGAGGSAIGEVGGLTKFLKGTPAGGVDPATSSVAAIGTTSILGMTDNPDVDVNLHPHIDADIPSGSLTDGVDAPNLDVTSNGLKQAGDLDITAPLPVADANTSKADIDITEPLPVVNKGQTDLDATAPLPVVDQNTSQVADISSTKTQSQEMIEFNQKVDAEIKSVDPFDPSYAQKVADIKYKAQLEAQTMAAIHATGMTVDQYIAKCGEIPKFDPATTAIIQQQAKAIADRAVQIEPNVTNLMLSLQDPTTKLTGIEYRFKSLSSIESKISRTMSSYGYSAFDAASQVNDSLRYTLICDSGSYTDTVIAKLAKLKSEGYQIKYMNNAWGNSTYKGLNITLVGPDGVDIELQFHTQSSFNVKQNQNHLWYEISRSPNVDPNIKNLANQVQAMNQAIYNTDNVAFNYAQFDPTGLNKDIDAYIASMQPSTTQKRITVIDVPEEHAYTKQISQYQDGYIKYKGTDIPAEAVIDDINVVKTYGANVSEALAKIEAKYGKNSIQYVTATGTIAQAFLQKNPAPALGGINTTSGVKGTSSRIVAFYDTLGIKAKDVTQDVVVAAGGNSSIPQNIAEQVCQTYFADSYNGWGTADISVQKGMKTFTGGSYTPINRALRNGDSSFLSTDMIDGIVALHGYLDASPGLSETTLMYRGLNDLSWIGNGTLQYKSGQALVNAINALGGGIYDVADNGFESSTPVLGQGFTQGCQIVEVTACPPGTKGAYIGNKSTCDWETEWLLNAGEGNKKVILGSELIDGKVYVYTQIIPNS